MPTFTPISPEKKRESFQRFIRNESPEEIAAALGFGSRTVYRWIKDEDWRRAKQLAWRKGRDKMISKAATEISQEQRKLVTIVQASIARYTENLLTCAGCGARPKPWPDDGNCPTCGKRTRVIDPQTPRELESLIRSYHLLIGRPTGILETQDGGGVNAPFEIFMEEHAPAVLEGIIKGAIASGNGELDGDNGDGDGAPASAGEADVSRGDTADDA